MNLKQRILELLSKSDGLSDRELTDRLIGPKEPPQTVNQAARGLADARRLSRKPRPDGKLGNFISPAPMPAQDLPLEKGASTAGEMSEDEVKKALRAWLEADGWACEVKWGQVQGTDIDAVKAGARHVIEAKGCGSLGAMRHNYFLAVLGEILQRMGDEQAKYSIAFPDMRQFRRLWQRLPALVKKRLGLTALFVAADWTVEEVE